MLPTAIKVQYLCVSLIKDVQVQLVVSVYPHSEQQSGDVAQE